MHGRMTWPIHSFMIVVLCVGGETGYGFVAYADPMTAGIAINKLNTRLIDGHNIRVTDGARACLCEEAFVVVLLPAFYCGVCVMCSSPLDAGSFGSVCKFCDRNSHIFDPHVPHTRSGFSVS